MDRPLSSVATRIALILAFAHAGGSLAHVPASAG